MLSNCGVWAGLRDGGWGHLTGYKVQIRELKVRHPGDKESNQKVSSCITQGAQLSALWQPRVVIMGCGAEGGSRGRGHIYTYGWFVLLYCYWKNVWVLATQKPINRPGWWKEKFALFQMLATEAGGGWQMFVQRPLFPSAPLTNKQWGL